MASSVPSTATVLEFRCLFTHDLRRKQKRWQDGRLKYHTFNARVMVYDERGNSVGDMHWHGEYGFGEGEEIQLDRGGVIVQVEDLVERRETDLSELVDKRVQEKQQRQMQQLARSVAPSSILPRSLARPPATAPDPAQPPRHRPLCHVIGTPTGHHGKALVPKGSPFEQRQQTAESPDERTAKRRKYDEPPPSKSGYASALFGQTLTLSATPSSSVSVVRRPRPEERSDPPAETGAQYPRGDLELARREQPLSSRRLNQRGYAQSLFGQSLTLSHTPLSSVPSRPQPRNESVLNATVDNNTEQLPGTARRSAPQQLNELRHLDRPRSNSRSALLSNQSRISNSLATGSAEVDKSKRRASLSRQYHATNPKQTIPESIGLIEIDDPEPITPPPVRQPRTQKIAPKGLRNLEGHLDSSNVAAGMKDLSQEESVRSGRQQSSDSGRQDKFTEAKSYERSSKPEIAVSKANNSNASFGCADPATHEHTRRAPVASRDPALPVTELRIKSSKKRGLLMISDASKSKKTRRQVHIDSARPFHGDSTHCLRGSDNDDPFHESLSSRLPSNFESCRDVGESTKTHTMPSRHTPRNGENEDNYPVLNRDGEWEKNRVVGELGKKSAERLISTELGEDDDPFQSQSLDQTYDRPKSATKNSTKQLGHEKPMQVEATTTTRNPADAGLFFVGNDREEPADVIQPTKHSPSSPRAEYDPYRIMPSPRSSSPGIPSSAQRKGREHDVAAEILRPIDNDRKLNKAKSQRHSQRKVVADEDDEDDVDLPAPSPGPIDSGPDPEPGIVPVLREEAANKQPKPRKPTTIRALQDIPTVESGDDRSRRSSRKTTSQQMELGVESEEDELPIVRHRSRRQRRSRATSSEQPSPLPSEQDGSEEEGFPMKRRNTRTSKASGHRPRLEKIKKNVKSRELIGFNLAALNAPLGLRGVGMPFSILPSPVNESIQRWVPSHAVVDENPVVDGEVEDPIPSRSPESPAAAVKTNPQVQQSPNKRSNGEATNQPPLQTFDSHVCRRTSPNENVSGAMIQPDGARNPNIPGLRDSSKSGGPGANLQSLIGTENKQTVNQAPSLEQERTPYEPTPSKASLEAQHHHAAAPTPRGIATAVAAEQTLSSPDQPVQKSSALPRKSSTIAKHTTFDNTTNEAYAKKVANAKSPSVPAQTTTTEPANNTGLSIRDKCNVNGQQPLNTVQAIRGVKGAPTKESVAADRRPNLAAESEAATSLNQEKPETRRQPCILESANASNAVVSGSNVQADTSMAPSAMDEPDPALSRPSLTSRGQDTATVETNVGNTELDRTSDLPVRPPNAIGLRRQVSAPRRINNIGAKSTPQAERAESSSTDVHSKPASNVRLANPASRGRKAALASHAAGPVPQRVLPPMQPDVMMPISTADLAMTPIEQTIKAPERPKKKMTFPGFQSARSDGPWSREAFDLLESGRPE